MAEVLQTWLNTYIYQRWSKRSKLILLLFQRQVEMTSQMLLGKTFVGAEILFDIVWPHTVVQVASFWGLT